VLTRFICRHIHEQHVGEEREPENAEHRN